MKENETRAYGIRDAGMAIFTKHNLPKNTVEYVSWEGRIGKHIRKPNVDQQSQPIIFQSKYLQS